MSGMKFDRNEDAPEYEDCFDACAAQCRLTKREGKRAVHLFEPKDLSQQHELVGGRNTMVRYVAPPSANAARFASGSAGSGSVITPREDLNLVPSTPSADPQRAMVRHTWAPTARSGKYAAQKAPGAGWLALKTHAF